MFVGNLVVRGLEMTCFGLTVLHWELPFKDIRCTSTWFKQVSAVGGGPEMGLG